ncbi:BolA family protein [Wolbachia endosymbiont of Wuchereria bancrofti]|uniref:cell division protein BolA n=1 Tax=Wolbachia endosymbiont of Wuchereria bancrofti TaxID=96496 RepID=UPI00034D300F|nr:cell division protein BolA [Wolbachia endosymbiont of Wuchereria bancrofti]OWZ25375.1 putative stress-induced morphogen, BolA [Wolbachia endosymbiont of Wuchereria bancrofti]
MVIVIHELGEIIRQLFSDTDIKINDLAGDDGHYYLKITSKHLFEKTKIEQYRIAYKALEGQSIYALQLETST